MEDEGTRTPLPGARRTPSPHVTSARQAAQLTVLADVARQIVAELEPAHLFEMTAHLVQVAFGYYHVSIFMLDPASGDLVLQARASLLASSYVPVIRLKPDVGIVGWVIEHGQPRLSGDVSGEPLFYNPRDLPTRSELCVPIRYAGETLGVLDVQSPYLAAFDEGDEAVLMTLADLIAVAVHNARAFEETARLKAFHESIVRHVSEGIVVEDARGVFSFVNPAAAELLGYAPEALIGRHWTTVVAPEHRSLVEAADARRTQGQVDRYEIDLIRKDGTHLPTRVAGAPWYDPISGAFAGSLAVFTDLSDEKRLEAQVRRAQKMDALGRLARGVAHDFNNLLSVIRLSTQMLRARLAEAEDDAVVTHLDRIEDADRRASELTRQLLSFSRQDTGQPRRLNLRDAVTDLGAMLHSAIGDEVTLDVRADDDLWPIKIDRSQLDQVIMNLAVNARDAMPAGGTLTIEMRNLTLRASGDAPGLVTEEGVAAPPDLQAGPHVLLAVQDTGAGMPPEIEARLFEPFFTTKEPGPGTGLGLATVFGIVKQNRGSIQVETEPGRGTTVRVYFPRAAETGTAALEREIRQP